MEGITGTLIHVAPGPRMKVVLVSGSDSISDRDSGLVAHTLAPVARTPLVVRGRKGGLGTFIM